MAENEDERTTYSIKPFVSHDGGDGNGGAPAEVLVAKGVGIVDKMNADNKVTAEIFIRVDGLKRPIRGWIKKSEDAYAIALESYKTKEPIQYRQEIQRKEGVDRSTPIADLRTNMDIARDNTKKLMVGFGRVHGPLVLTSEHLTNPDDDNPSGRGVAAGSKGATQGDRIAAADAAAAGDIEQRAWIGVNNDGSINIGSYAISGGVAMFTSIIDKFGGADPDSAGLAAGELMRMVDALQVQMYSKTGGSLRKANRLLSSHTLGRKITQDLISKSNIDEVDLSDAESRGKWERGIIRGAYAAWLWAVEDYKTFI